MSPVVLVVHLYLMQAAKRKLCMLNLHKDFISKMITANLFVYTTTLYSVQLCKFYFVLQSTLSKTDTVRNGPNCPSYRGVRLIESQGNMTLV